MTHLLDLSHLLEGVARSKEHGLCHGPDGPSYSYEGNHCVIGWIAAPQQLPDSRDVVTLLLEGVLSAASEGVELTMQVLQALHDVNIYDEDVVDRIEDPRLVALCEDYRQWAAEEFRLGNHTLLSGNL